MADARIDGDTHAHDRASTASRAGGAAAGGLGGAVAGAAVGTITAGPIGTIVGAIAGAVGGGWVGLAAGDASRHYGAAHDDAYRAHYEGSADRLADRGFDHARPAYQLGHLASLNPDYAGRRFEEVEPHLRQGWSDDLRANHGDWQSARRWARHAYESGGTYGAEAPLHGSIERSRMMSDIGDTASHQRPSYSDPIPPGDPDHVSGEREIPGRGEA